jgi:hypothetical protein
MYFLHFFAKVGVVYRDGTIFTEKHKSTLNWVLLAPNLTLKLVPNLTPNLVSALVPTLVPNLAPKLALSVASTLAS